MICTHLQLFEAKTCTPKAAEPRGERRGAAPRDRTTGGGRMPRNPPVFSWETHKSLDWSRGNSTGKSHMNHGKIYGFRLRFSLKSTHWTKAWGTAGKIWENGKETREHLEKMWKIHENLVSDKNLGDSAGNKPEKPRETYERWVKTPAEAKDKDEDD